MRVRCLVRRARDQVWLSKEEAVTSLLASSANARVRNEAGRELDQLEVVCGVGIARADERERPQVAEHGAGQHAPAIDHGARKLLAAAAAAAGLVDPQQRVRVVRIFERMPGAARFERPAEHAARLGDRIDGPVDAFEQVIEPAIPRGVGGDLEKRSGGSEEVGEAARDFRGVQWAFTPPNPQHQEPAIGRS